MPVKNKKKYTYKKNECLDSPFEKGFVRKFNNKLRSGFVSEAM